jgi:glucose-6-phosphate isomerase
VLEHPSHLIAISASTEICYPFNQTKKRNIIFLFFKKKRNIIPGDLAPKESENRGVFQTDYYFSGLLQPVQNATGGLSRSQTRNGNKNVTAEIRNQDRTSQIGRPP